MRNEDGLIGLSIASFITAGEDGGFQSALYHLFREILDDGGFSRTASGDVPDRYDRNR